MNRPVPSACRVVWGAGGKHPRLPDYAPGYRLEYCFLSTVPIGPTRRGCFPLVPEFRNDRQLLFRVILGAQRVEQVHAYPLELGLGHTRAAGAEARHWIAGRFEWMCGELGSRVEHHDGWLHVLP